MRPPEASGRLGGLVTQAGMQAWFTLQPQEVVLLKYHPAGAAYAAMQLTDWWFRSIDAHKRLSSLTQAQAIPGADGWIECVIAREDPGYANWLDTGGLSTVLLLGRWQGLSREVIPDQPWVTTEVISAAQLQSRGVIAGGNVSPDERQLQIQMRQSAWQRRVDLVEGK
jgi:hypothetical protein